MLTFEQALKQSSAKSHRHVLLGNGFSRACRNDIFSYDALFERADFQQLSGSAKALFEALETTDFESVIEALRQAALIVPLYFDDSGLAHELEHDAASLRDVLVSAMKNEDSQDSHGGIAVAQHFVTAEYPGRSVVVQ